MKQILITASFGLLFLAEAFTFPLIHKWYCSEFFNGKAGASGVPLIMAMVFMMAGTLIIIITKASDIK